MQPSNSNGEDRGSIIDAAYECMAQAQSGPIPVAAILARAGVSSRAFYRHFDSKDELFLAMLRQECDAMADQLDRVAREADGTPVQQLERWITQMFSLIHDPQRRMHMVAIDSEEVRAARGYREAREQTHADRERSLAVILERGRSDGSFPLAEPGSDAVAILAVVSRELTAKATGPQGWRCAQKRALDFALRALGVPGRG